MSSKQSLCDWVQSPKKGVPPTQARQDRCGLPCLTLLKPGLIRDPQHTGRGPHPAFQTRSTEESQSPARGREDEVELSTSVTGGHVAKRAAGGAGRRGLQERLGSTAGISPGSITKRCVRPVLVMCDARRGAAVGSHPRVARAAGESGVRVARGTSRQAGVHRHGTPLPPPPSGSSPPRDRSVTGTGAQSPTPSEKHQQSHGKPSPHQP